MARIRMIKPEFFDDPEIADLSPLAQLFFIGLWTHADREGRLVDDMRRLGAKIFPYAPVDCESLAVELHGKDMIRRYSTGEKRGWIWVRSFLKHQRPHPKEPASVIPAWSDTAVEKHGEPCKETAGTSESGTRNLGHGILDMEEGQRERVSSEPPRMQRRGASIEPESRSPETTDRSARLLERYGELFQQYRRGAKYFCRPHIDLPDAEKLTALWDDARLENMMKVFLTAERDEWINKTDRGFRVFSMKATLMDQWVREWEEKQRESA